MKDFFIGLFKNTSNTMIERTKNPLIGAFVLSWTLYNWKFVLILIFSDSNIEDKVKKISAFLDCYSLIVPAIAAILYPFLINILDFLTSYLLKAIYSKSVKLKSVKTKDILIESKEIEILRADADIAYEQRKTGIAKEIQYMNEQIAESKEKESILLKEKETILTEKNEVIKEKNILQQEILELNKSENKLRAEYNYIKNQRNKSILSDLSVQDIKESLIDSIINNPKMDSNRDTIDVSSHIRIIMQKIPNLPNYSEEYLFSEYQSLYQFIQGLNIEQLIYFNSSLNSK
ncbi:hypothetical protein [Providencia sp. PROV079]|uniref:hypothetical protein n=1 Tax=Providencia sp. PROV079 TaxID=2949800 RepID=UPI0023495E0C|nr:hypothetical protein [Providencia sp. PROV079]